MVKRISSFLEGDFNNWKKSQAEQQKQQEELRQQQETEARRTAEWISSRPSYMKALDVVLPGQQFRTPPPPSEPISISPLTSEKAALDTITKLTGLPTFQPKPSFGPLAQFAGGVAEELFLPQILSKVTGYPKERFIMPEPETTGQAVGRWAGRFTGMSVPIGGAYATAGKGLVRAATRVAPKVVAKPLVEAAVRGAGGFGAYGAGKAAVEGGTPREIAKAGVVNAIMGAVADPAVAAIGARLAPYAERILPFLRKKPAAAEPLALPAGRAEPLALLAPKTAGELPEFTTGGAIQRPGAVGQRPGLPMPQEEAIARQYAERARLELPLNTQTKAQVDFYRLMDDIRQSVIEKGVPPMEREKELVNFIYEGLGGQISKNEIRKMSYGDLADLASQVAKERPVSWELAKSEAAKRGIDLDELYRTATDTEYARLKEVAGLGEEPIKPYGLATAPAKPEAELNAARNILKKSKNPETATKIFNAYPELKQEFPLLAKKTEKQLLRAKEVKAPPKPPPGAQAEIKEIKKQPPKPPLGAQAETLEGLKAAEQKLGEKVQAKIPDPMRTGIVGIPLKGPKKSKYAFENPEIEARWQKSKELPQPSLTERIKEAVSRTIKVISREYEHLPRTGEYSPLRFELTKLLKQRGIVEDRTLRNIQGITAKLDQESYDLFTRKVVLDDLANTKGELPFGFTEETLKAEKARIDKLVEENPFVKEAIQDRKKLWQEIKNEYVKAFESIGQDMSERFNRKDYYRHLVLEYIENTERRGFLKKRLGSKKDILSEYVLAEYEVMAQMLHDIEVAKAMKKIKDVYDIRPRLEKEGVKVAENIPAGYVRWQPKHGGLFYLNDSIPFRAAEKMYRAALEELGITEKELQRAMVKSGHFDYWVIKEEIAKTLDNLTKKVSDDEFGQLLARPLRAWKQYQLISPTRVVKYNLRNLSGDAEAVAVGNPAAFKRVPQAAKELYDVFAKDAPMTPELKEWFERGGMQSTLQFQEMGDIKNLKIFADLFERKGKITELPVKAWKGYWKTARLSTDFREALLRYANYLEYLAQMKANKGIPKNFGASLREEVMALPDIRDRAFKLANDLLGAYDEVSVAGQWLRKYIYPFWSWKEVNLKRYARLVRNAVEDGQIATLAGRKLATTALRSPLIAYNIGKFAIKASAFWAMLQAYNNLRFPEEERDLPEYVKARPHIIFGRDEKGDVRYFSSLGTLADALAWFGLDAPQKQVTDWLNGRVTLKEAAEDMAKNFINSIVQGIGPTIKLPTELLLSRQTFPDVFKTRPIRDRKLYLAEQFGLGEEYKNITGLPHRPYSERLKDLLYYTSDPGQSAYSYIQDEKNDFLRKLGKAGSFWGTATPKSNALYNYKLAIRYKDQKAAEKYLAEYIMWGGTKQGLKTSLRNMEPLHGLNKKEKAMFVEQLDEEGKNKLKQAQKFYEEVLLGR